MIQKVGSTRRRVLRLAWTVSVMVVGGGGEEVECLAKSLAVAGD